MSKTETNVRSRLEKITRFFENFRESRWRYVVIAKNFATMEIFVKFPIFASTITRCTMFAFTAYLFFATPEHSFKNYAHGGANGSLSLKQI